MAAEYHINEADELVTLRFHRRVSLTQVRDCVNMMFADELFRPDMPQLVDLREARPVGSEQQSVEVENFVTDFYRHKVTATIAIVSNLDWDQELCAWIYWLSCALENAELFDEWTQACRWLVRHEFNNSADSAARTAAASSR